MKDKLNKWLIIGVVVGLVAMVIGYVLWADFSAAQEMGQTALEAAQTQESNAISEPIGEFLLNAGFVAFFGCLAALVIWPIIKYFKK